MKKKSTKINRKSSKTSKKTSKELKRKNPEREKFVQTPYGVRCNSCHMIGKSIESIDHSGYCPNSGKSPFQSLWNLNNNEYGRFNKGEPMESILTSRTIRNPNHKQNCPYCGNNL